MFIYQKLRLSSAFAFRAIIVLFFRAVVWRVPRRGRENETENEREKADEMEGKKMSETMPVHLWIFHCK